MISINITAADRDLLKQAIEALGLRFTENKSGLFIQTPNGQITIIGDKATLDPTSQGWLNKIKQSYSRQVLEKVSKKYRFTLTNKGENKITMRRY